VTIDTNDLSPEESAQEIFLCLEREGFIGASSENGQTPVRVTGNQ